MTDSQFDAKDILAALGIDPATIVFPAPRREDSDEPAMGWEPCRALDESEWALIRSYLPPEPMQAEAISNREFVEAVLWVLQQRKAWTQLPGDRSEAVRKKFARWAHGGFWEHLAEGAQGRGLPPHREAQLASLAKRAARLQARMRSRRAPD